MSSRYLDPTNDVAFKKLFSQKDLLKDFLNAVLRLEEGCKIVELDFIPQEELPSFKIGRRSLFDIKCKDQEGKYYVVEMQNKPESSFLNRVQCYASHAYVSQAIRGATHEGLMPVILLVISKENLFEEDIECISYHHTVESQTKKQLLFALSYVFIELPKFTKSAKDLKNGEDDWLYFFAHWQESKEPPESITDSLVLEAYKTIEQFNWTPEEYDAYFRARLLSDAEDILLTDSFEKGIERGRKETEAALKKVKQEKEAALKKVKEEKETALKKAKEEKETALKKAEKEKEAVLKKAKEEMAKTLLLQGIEIEIVSKTTGLSKEDIRKFCS
jgi:predicted transposase/invertase (TIGR01784 family)